MRHSPARKSNSPGLPFGGFGDFAAGAGGVDGVFASEAFVVALAVGLGHGADGLADEVGRVGLESRVDWLTSYGLDLEQGEACEVRKLAVSKLRALGDVRAIPVLVEAVARKGKYGRDKGKPVNTCLADDAQAALVYLRSLGAPR